MSGGGAPTGQVSYSDERFWPCPDCGWDVNEGILTETPDCPHGWSSFKGMTIADIKAEFAVGCDDLSIDP